LWILAGVLGLLLFVSIFIPVENIRIILNFWGIVAGTGLITEGLKMRKMKQSQHESPA